MTQNNRNPSDKRVNSFNLVFISSLFRMPLISRSASSSLQIYMRLTATRRVRLAFTKSHTCVLLCERSRLDSM